MPQANKVKETDTDAVVAEMKMLREEIHQLKCAVLTLAHVQIAPRLEKFQVSPHDEVTRFYREFVNETREE